MTSFNYASGWTHIFSPTTTLEVGFGTNQPNNPNLTTNSAVQRADFFQQTGIQMYQTDVFSNPLVNIGFRLLLHTGRRRRRHGDNIWQWRSNLSHDQGQPLAQVRRAIPTPPVLHQHVEPDGWQRHL